MVIYTLAFFLVGRLVQGQFPPPADLSGLWFYAGVAALVLGTFLQDSFYATPADALFNGVALLFTIIGLTPVGTAVDPGLVILGRLSFGAYAGVVIGLAAVAISFKDEPGLLGRIAAASSRAARLLGSGSVLYSLVFFAAALAAFPRDTTALAVLYLAWIAFFHLAPVERALAFLASIRKTAGAFGVVEKVVDPGLIVVRLRPGETASVGAQVELGMPSRDGVVVNVTSLLGEPRLRVAMAMGTAVEVGSQVHLKAAPLVPSVVGFTDVGTTLSELKVELVPGGAKRGLEIGRLLEVAVGERSTLFQVVSAAIDEDHERDHTRTPSRASATKLGCWNDNRSTFALEPWMPEPGAPVTLINVVDATFDRRYLGHIPDTSYGIGVKVHEAVTHNTAILGILGVGKTHLAWELIHRMLSDSIKAVVLDITGRYAMHFADLCPPTIQQDHERSVQERIAGRRTAMIIVGGEAGNVRDFDIAIRELLGRFMRGPSSLMILNPNLFDVSRMSAGMNYRDPARALGLSSLSVVDITRKVSEALLELVQAMPDPQDERARCA